MDRLVQRRYFALHTPATGRAGDVNIAAKGTMLLSWNSAEAHDDVRPSAAPSKSGSARAAGRQLRDGREAAPWRSPAEAALEAGDNSGQFLPEASGPFARVEPAGIEPATSCLQSRAGGAPE